MWEFQSLIKEEEWSPLGAVNRRKFTFIEILMKDERDATGAELKKQKKQQLSTKMQIQTAVKNT